MEPDVQSHVQVHTIPSITTILLCNDLGSKDRQQKRPSKYKLVSIKLLWCLVASTSTLLVIPHASLYIALINKKFHSSQEV